MHDYSKICRVCMSNGSRDIFHRSNVDPSSNPLERLLEKMRYVTMMKIEENDDLPRLICDLCIVQLNVAYNFKRQAVENDTKLRQYFIEHGISSHHSNITTTNEPSKVGSNTNSSNVITQNTIDCNNSNHIINNATSSNNLETASVRSNLTSTHSTANISPLIRRNTNNYPLLPIVIKTEPETDEILIDDLSDSIIDTTNDVNNKTSNETSALVTIVKEVKTGTNYQSNEKNRIPLNQTSSSMVYLNGYNINTLTPSSEVESYHNINMNSTMISDEVVQLSSGSSSSINSNSRFEKSYTNQTIVKSSSNKIINEMLNNDKRKTLSPAELTRKKLAQKRLGGQLKTRRILPEKRPKKRVYKDLQIDMAPPSGKISREELKKKLYFGKQQRSTPNNSTSVQRINENEKILNKNKSKVNENINPKIVLNPFNARDKRKTTSPAYDTISTKNSRRSLPIKQNTSSSILEKQSKTNNTQVHKSNQANIRRTISTTHGKRGSRKSNNEFKLLEPKIEPSSKI